VTTLADARRRANAARRAVNAAGGLLSERQLAQELGVSHTALQKRRDRGTLTDTLGAAGSMRVYTRADLEVMLAERRGYA